MKRIVVPVVLLVATVCACSQRGFSSNVEVTPQPVPGVDFSQYKVWMSGRESYPETGIEHIDTPQFRVAVAKHFMEEMTKRGYVNSTENPDFVFLMHVASEQKYDQQKMDDIYKGYDMAQYQLDENDVWQEGTILLFAMDAKTGKQVWSSTAHAKLQEYVGYDDRLQRFNRVISMMLADFPARVAQ